MEVGDAAVPQCLYTRRLVVVVGISKFISPISLVSMMICRDQLLNAYDCVGLHLDSGCATDVLYFDNSKALDVINPAVLLSTE